MKAETKAKIAKFKDRAKKFIHDYGGPIFMGMTVGAAWKGYTNSNRLAKELAHTRRVVDHNADVQQADRDKLLELEHQQTRLFEKALEITEGKAN